MKLNYKRVIFVGFAFFLINLFWQAYDTVIPLILTNKFGMKQTTSGIIMAFDNIFAVVMLPIFGRLSDKTMTKLGRRTPYIFFGTVLAAFFFALLGIADSLSVFIAILLATLISMATFRSPAVALMPDVTVKPLRSAANAVINLMGTVGGIIVLILAFPFNTSEEGKTDFTLYLITISIIMIIALVAFLLTVRERKWAAEMEAESARLGSDRESEEIASFGGKLSKGQRTSLLLILASVALWYIGYNAITSKYSVVATNYLGVKYQTTLMLAQVAAIISYLPVGIIASKIGRKKTILAGVATLTLAAVGLCFVRPGTSVTLISIFFVLAGIGWATINVNSFPMAVELASSGDVGKYTGYYYTASMAAQVVTPVFSGYVMDKYGEIMNLSRPGYEALFPYSAVFCGLAFITMLFVRHGDSKPKAEVGIESFSGEGD